MKKTNWKLAIAATVFGVAVGVALAVSPVPVLGVVWSFAFFGTLSRVV